MKPRLAVLPMDLWADVFVFNNRQQLAQIVDRFKNRAFAEKLQKFLHDPKCGKHSLRYLHILYLRNEKNLASFSVAASAFSFPSSYKYFEFPESEMPENITSFKRLSIGHLDDEVLAFLDKIKPLFTDVFLNISYSFSSTKQAMNSRIFFSHLLPMLCGIRRISCDSECVQFLERHFPETLALAKELDLFDDVKPASIPAYLSWLSATLDFVVHGPKFLRASAGSETISAIVNAVRQKFLATTTSSAALVIFLQFGYRERNFHVEEFNLENATTNEQLTVRNAKFEEPKFGLEINYVEVVRHPRGADSKMREWIEQRAYFEKKYKAKHVFGIYEGEADDEEKLMWIKQPTIGRITKKSSETNQHEDGPDDDDQQYEAGPSTSAKKMKK